MDRTELKSNLKNFQDLCAKRGMPLADLCVEEAYPGDNSTSFIVKVKAAWVDDMPCSKALDFLFDVLWESSDENIRTKIFMIQVLDSSDDLHCWQSPNDSHKE